MTTSDQSEIGYLPRGEIMECFARWVLVLFISGCTGPTASQVDDAKAPRDMLAVFPDHCMDDVVNQDETDTDCGGDTCAKCGDNKTCIRGADCASAVCLNNKCAIPTCADMFKNGTETDVDCGGACSACVAGQICLWPTDCVSGICINNLCVGANCTDGVRNGAETDIDCGGRDCLPCGNGMMCILAGDCLSTSCINNLCGAGMNEVKIGYPVSFADHAEQAGNYLTALPVMIDKQSTLLRIGVIGKIAGVHIVLGLYRDKNGTPDGLIINTATMPLLAAAQEFSVPMTLLAPGAYWIAWTVDAQASFGYDTKGMATIAFTQQKIAFQTPLPMMFPMPSLNNTLHPMNFWLVVR